MPCNANTDPAAARQLQPTVYSEKNTYTNVAKLSGHTGLVICMSVTEDGKLASGGLDGVRIWDLRRSVRQHQAPVGHIKEFGRPSGAGHLGATTALAWIRREDEPDDGLVFGTAAGYVVSWKETVNTRGDTSFEETYCIQLAKPGEITAIAFEAGSNRLAVSNRNSVIQVFQVGPKLDLHCVFSVVVKDHIPKAISFGQTGDDKDLYTFGLYDGQIHTLSGLDGKVKHSRQTGCQIGNAAINLRRGVFCIDDPAQGVALYRSDSWDRVRTYPVDAEKSQRPRQVTFAENCKFIISGSDHGVVYVFDRRSGNMVDKLMSGSGRIQAVAAMEQEEVPFIFSAMHGRADEACNIVVWKKNTNLGPKSSATGPAMPTPEYRSRLKMVLHACMLVMAIAFLGQNFGPQIAARFPFA